MGVAAGAYIPLGNLSVLGPHPSLGFSFGWRFNKFMIDGDLSARYQNPATRNFMVNYKDTLYQTSSYMSGGYSGLNIGYELDKRDKHEWDILAGGGTDIFSSALNHEKYTVDFKTFNANLGLGYKLFVKHIPKKEYPSVPSHQYNRRIKVRPERYSYLAFQVKYNFLNYNNHGGTDLSGNAATISIAYGICDHRYQK